MSKKDKYCCNLQKRATKILRRGAVTPLFFVGYCVVSSSEELGTRLINLSLSERLVLRGLCEAYGREGERRVLFGCTLRVYKRIIDICRRSGDECPLLVAEVGLPSLFRRLKFRIGAMLGAIFAAVIVFSSLGHIWDIRVSGNESLSDSEVIDLLCDAGLSVGARKRTLDVDEIENRTLILSDSLSWIAVNLRGTVANVQVIEKKPTPQNKETKPANLIASQNGEILSLEVYSGKTVVKVGDIVTKGDLLVSGIYDSKADIFRLRRSSGRVYARTAHTITVEVPFEYTKKEYTGVEKRENTLIFFSNIIKLSKNSGNLPVKCDTIKERYSPTLLDGKGLPFAVESVRYLEYREVRASRSIEDAVSLAFRRLEGELYAHTRESFLLSKRITTSIGEDSVTLTCDIRLIEDIASISEFEYSFD